MVVRGNNKPSEPMNLFGYEVITSLGEGAASVIYAVCQKGSNQLLALKHVICREERDQRYYEQLQTEYEVGRRISHPGLRRSFELKLTKTWAGRVTEAVLVMELVDGVPLDQQRPSSIAQTLDCFVQVAAALEALHALGYIHCDLKPNNILRATDGRTRVIDLGQACTVNSVKQRVQGTADYIAPEQVKLRPITCRTDVFNFGATLYWSLTNQPLPTFLNVAKGKNSFILDEAMTPPHHINEQVPEPLGWLVMECVRTEPKKRPELSEVKRRLETMAFAAMRHGAPAGAPGAVPGAVAGTVAGASHHPNTDVQITHQNPQPIPSAAVTQSATAAPIPPPAA